MKKSDRMPCGRSIMIVAISNVSNKQAFFLVPLTAAECGCCRRDERADDERQRTDERGRGGCLAGLVRRLLGGDLGIVDDVDLCNAGQMGKPRPLRSGATQANARRLFPNLLHLLIGPRRGNRRRVKRVFINS